MPSQMAHSQPQCSEHLLCVGASGTELSYSEPATDSQVLALMYGGHPPLGQMMLCLSFVYYNAALCWYVHIISSFDIAVVFVCVCLFKIGNLDGSQ